MIAEICVRGKSCFEIYYGDQIVGTIKEDSKHRWEAHFFITTWDYFNPAHVERIKSMTAEKVKLLNITARLTK